MRNLTVKTLFLVALASAKRIGELQALLSRLQFWAGFVLVLRPRICYQNGVAFHPIPGLFLLKSLADFAANLEEELLLVWLGH